MSVPPESKARGPRPRKMPAIGEVFAGKYLIEGEIARGGMGVVYAATHLRMRQSVAIKLIAPQMGRSKVALRRFEREARATAQLRGQHIARIFDVDVSAESQPYIVMERLAGRDLAFEAQSRAEMP